MIKKKEEELITGQENRITFTKDNSKLENAMEEELFGGKMGAGTKVNSEKVDNKDKAAYIEPINKNSIKVIG